GPPLRAFPFYPTLPRLASGYDNTSPEELRNHPSLADHFFTSGDDRVFAASNLEALLRYGDTGSAALTSELFRLCPTLFMDAKVRGLGRTQSFEVDIPALPPWLYDWRTSGSQIPAATPKAYPQGPAQTFPALTRRQEPRQPIGEFGPDWRAQSPWRGRF